MWVQGSLSLLKCFSACSHVCALRSQECLAWRVVLTNFPGFPCLVVLWICQPRLEISPGFHLSDRFHKLIQAIDSSTLTVHNLMVPLLQFWVSFISLAATFWKSSFFLLLGYLDVSSSRFLPPLWDWRMDASLLKWVSPIRISPDQWIFAPPRSFHGCSRLHRLSSAQSLPPCALNVRPVKVRCHP